MRLASRYSRHDQAAIPFGGFRYGSPHDLQGACARRNEILAESGVDVKTLSNIKLVHHVGNPTIRRHLDQIPLHSFTLMMILVDESRETNVMHSDSHSLASLLMIRDIQSTLAPKSSSNACKCITEILDPRTQKTITASTTILQLSELSKRMKSYAVF